MCMGTCLKCTLAKYPIGLFDNFYLFLYETGPMLPFIVKLDPPISYTIFCLLSKRVLLSLIE